MSSPRTLIPTHEVQDQVILPLRVAVGICLSGIRTRLGRSAITLFGVALGTAFLMAVLSSFHIQQAMREDAARARDVERRLAALRNEVGTLKNRSFLVLMAEGRESDRAFVAALAAQAAAVRVLSALPEAGGGQAHAIILLGTGARLLSAELLSDTSQTPVLTFDRPTAEAAERVAASRGRLRHLGIELRPDEIERAREREREARLRMLWILAVSLLITIGSVANAMLMSVTERFREIGTMKCLGALSSFVVKLFFIESSLLGLVGSAAGCVAGAAFSLLAYGYTFQFARVLGAVNWAALAAYAGLCLVAGVVLAIVAAIYPARVAAKMIPAAALASHV